MLYVGLTLVLAAFFWFVTFSLHWLNFWLSMSLSVIVLTGLAIYWGEAPWRRRDWNRLSIGSGIASAAGLYSIFWLGNIVAGFLFSFAQPQIASIYAIRTQGEAATIVFILLFITSPGEEIFWRGFIQKRLSQKFGRPTGYLLASFLYAAVHIASGNLMLTLAALTAGLFWGWLYQRDHNLVSCIISHALWTVTVFVLLPIS
jgi:uncharacterized protein